MLTGAKIIPRRVALFDLDHTLLSLNTTYAFIRFFLIQKKRFSRPYFRYKWFVFCEVFGMSLGPGKRRDRYFRLLEGTPKELLVTSAQEFFNKTAPKYLNRRLFLRFQNLSKEGFYCCLVSSSFDFLVEAFRSGWVFDDSFASVSRFDPEGRCSGEFEKDMTGVKDSVIPVLERKLGPLDLKGSYFFTDNREDVPLARRIGNSFGVVKNGFQKYFWAQQNIETIQFIPPLLFSPLWFVLPLVYYFYFRTSLFAFLFYQLGALLLAQFSTTFGPIKDSGLLLLAIAGYLSLYEVGYFLNDAVAVKNETNPSLRMEEDTAKLIQRRFMISRFLFFCLMVGILGFWVPAGRLIIYVVLNLLTVLLFLMHNRLKQRQRYLTYAVLKCSHLIVPLSAFFTPGFPVVLPLLIVYLPIPLFYYVEKLREIPKVLCLRWYWVINVTFLTCVVVWMRASLLLSVYFLMGHLLSRKLGVSQVFKPVFSRTI